MLRSADIDFNKVVSSKPTSKDKTFLAYAVKNNKGICRLGISVPKANIRNATERNKVKRAIRHQFLDLKKLPIDIVVVYRGTANKYDAKLISSSLEFHKKKIIKITEKEWKT